MEDIFTYENKRADIFCTNCSNNLTVRTQTILSKGDSWPAEAQMIVDKAGASWWP